MGKLFTKIQPQNEGVVRVPTPFVDERGSIQNLVDCTLGSALVIRSNEGAVRGNHYHKTDFHYCWLEKGTLIYAHRPVGSEEPLREWVIRPGQMFYTPPMFEHVMLFTEDSLLFIVARNRRTMPNYEEDTFRIPALPVKTGP